MQQPIHAVEVRPSRLTTRAEIGTITDNAKLSWARRDYESMGVGKCQARRNKKKREDDLDENFEQLEEEAEESEAQEENLKRFYEACFRRTAFRRNENLNRDRLIILWGRGQNLMIEACRKLTEEDGRRTDKSRLTKRPAELDSPTPLLNLLSLQHRPHARLFPRRPRFVSTSISSRAAFICIRSVPPSPLTSNTTACGTTWQ